MFKPLVSCLLVLIVSSLAAGAKSYNGAELYSKSSVKYGKFDIRMRAVSGSGIVSSFFTYYDESYKGSPEPWQEIDIEVLGKDNETFQSNIITGNAASKKTSEEMHSFTNLSQSYHTYTVEWTPDYIAWFFNGKEVRRSTGSQVTDCQQKAMSYRFNLWISDVPSWVGSFDPAILPVYQYINWMSYAKYTPGAGVNGTDFTPEWRDDFDSFNTTRWGKGDWTFDGNLVDFSTENIVVKEGYCIICLTAATAKGFSGTVPKDLETSIVPEKPAALPVIGSSSTRHLPAFSVSLDGRLVAQKTIPLLQSSPGMLITTGKNSATPKIMISR